MTGAQLKDWFLVILGNIFIIILAARAVSYYARREWGELVMHIAAGVVIAGVIYFPGQVVSLLKTVWGLFSGNN